MLFEFKRLALLNTSVLRHLIINLENDYGYNASINSKKIKESAISKKRYEKHSEEKRNARDARDNKKEFDDAMSNIIEESTNDLEVEE
jgi:ribosomal protein S6